MVISYLTIYAIVFSCVALLGRPFAMTTLSQIEVTSFQGGSDPIGSKIHFQNHIKNNFSSSNFSGSSKNEIKTPGKHSDDGDFASPKSFPYRLSPPHRTYLASFDPVKNVTKKFVISEHYSNSTFPMNNKGSISVKKSLDGINEFKTIQNFIQWDTLRDYEKEIRVHYKGLTAKETLMSTGIDEETGKRQGLKLRQLTDGTHFIQLIYNFDNEIQDCEYIRQKSIVQKFLSSFRDNVEKAKIAYEMVAENPDEGALISHDFGLEDDDDYIEEDEGKIEDFSSEDDSGQYEGEKMYYAKDYRNVTFQIIRDGENLPRELAEWMNYPNLRRRCRENHRVLKQLVYNRNHGNARAKKVAEEHIERVKRNLDFSLIFPGTKWCGKSHTAEKYTALGGFSKTDKCCRTHDHCHPYIPAFEERYGFYNFRPYTLGHCRCDLRRKRDIMDVLLVPGTKWCGKGRRATKYTSLGGFSRTDKCCRIHDTMCPHWIGSLEQKYGLFNWRINTIMHCRCDKRFRACLKMAKTGTANFVGKLFFNVVQTKCFVLKPQEVCLKYSWWGKCEKKEYRKKAYLKDNLSY